MNLHNTNQIQSLMESVIPVMLDWSDSEYEIFHSYPRYIWQVKIVQLVMAQIDTLSDEDSYLQINWNDSLCSVQICLVPEEITTDYSSQTPYIRMKGYLAEFDPESETVSARKVSIPLPSQLSSFLSLDTESFTSVEYNPFTDDIALIMATTYLGKQPNLSSIDNRMYHTFADTVLLGGCRIEVPTECILGMIGNQSLGTRNSDWVDRNPKSPFSEGPQKYVLSLKRTGSIYQITLHEQDTGNIISQQITDVSEIQDIDSLTEGFIDALSESDIDESLIVNLDSFLIELQNELTCQN